MMISQEAFETQSAYRYPIETVANSLGSDVQRGLSSAQAQEIRQRCGKNELPSTPPTPAWRKFLAQFKGTLNVLLILATIISFIAWYIERDSPLPYEALTILTIVLLNGILGYVQENRAEQAIAALKAMSAATTRVQRDGKQQMIPTVDVVPGDILLVEEGDTIPADARVLEAIALRISESALTGESTPASKSSDPIENEATIADQRDMLFNGTAVSSGRGRAVVTAIGAQSEIGKIAGSLQESEDEETPLQKELDRVGRLLGIIVIAIAIVISVTILLVDQLSSLTEIVDVLLLAVSLAVAAVPEGLTAITTIVLSLGVQRMADRHVIVRKLSAVETLGSTTVICTDKTGTLTKNEMTVRTVITASGRVDFSGTGYQPEGEPQQHGAPLNDPLLQNEVEKALIASRLANNATLISQDERWTIQGDPTEGALVVAARKLGLRGSKLEKRFPRVGELPFSSERKLMSTAHHDLERGEEGIVFSKGAPDVLLARCTSEYVGDGDLPLSEERRREILTNVEQLASEALRTIGLAFRRLRRDAVTHELSEEVEQDLVWLGVVGMIDPPRPEALDAVHIAQRAGTRVIMITGDHPTTAVAIAEELGIIQQGERALSGSDLQDMPDSELRSLVRSVSVYARVAPEHKLRIVRALRANGEIVAMTGDGVNDAPALKTADIGVAMGITGTDVSKGAADMILTDDNFASIVAAIEEGRSIFSNIQKFLLYLLSSNIGEVLTMFFGVILAGFIGIVAEAGSGIIVPLIATQILWINLLTDSTPALALGVDPKDPHQMKRPPRDPRSGVLSRRMWFDIVYVGVIMTIGTLAVMYWALHNGQHMSDGLRYAQTMAFTTLVFFQLFNVFNVRSQRESAFAHLFTNTWIWWAILISLLLQIAVIYTPFLQTAFHTVALSWMEWLICLAVASFVLWLHDLMKLIVRVHA